MNGDGKYILSELSDPGMEGDETDALANSIITCLDRPHVEVPTIDELVDETIRSLGSTSIFKGVDTTGCGFIPKQLFQAERFAGPFNVTIRNTVIFENSLVGLLSFYPRKY
jgi:hypothetical protein